MFSVPSTARSFRDGTHIYCPLRRAWSSINTQFRPGIEPRIVAWQSIRPMLLLCYATSGVVEETRQSRLKHGVTHRRQFVHFFAWKRGAVTPMGDALLQCGQTYLLPPHTHPNHSKSRKQWNSLGKSCMKAGRCGVCTILKTALRFVTLSTELLTDYHHSSITK